MKLRHKIVLVLSAVLCLLFLLGESPPGQAFLFGKPRPSETHWEADDRHMGAGLAPLVYCLVPELHSLCTSWGTLFSAGFPDAAKTAVARKPMRPNGVVSVDVSH
jgi:hypothetical protein